MLGRQRWFTDEGVSWGCLEVLEGVEGSSFCCSVEVWFSVDQDSTDIRFCGFFCGSSTITTTATSTATATATATAERLFEALRVYCSVILSTDRGSVVLRFIEHSFCGLRFLWFYNGYSSNGKALSGFTGQQHGGPFCGEKNWGEQFWLFFLWTVLSTGCYFFFDKRQRLCQRRIGEGDQREIP